MSQQLVLTESVPITKPDYKGLSIRGMRGALKPIAYQLRRGLPVTNIFMDIVVRRRFGPVAGSPWSWKQRLRDMTRISRAVFGEVDIHGKLMPRRPVYTTEKKWFTRKQDGKKVCVVYYNFWLTPSEINRMIDEYERRFSTKQRSVA